ncbi:MAG: hypothetical protein ACI35R_18555 [Bacillus sp. (in: firmicutes)]
MKWILKVIMIAFILFAGYKYRYKLMNVLLGAGIIRKFVVAQSMKLPYGSTRLLQCLYRPF